MKIKGNQAAFQFEEARHVLLTFEDAKVAEERDGNVLLYVEGLNLTELNPGMIVELRNVVGDDFIDKLIDEIRRYEMLRLLGERVTLGER